jgi:hypothetical protein
MMKIANVFEDKHDESDQYDRQDHFLIASSEEA